MTEQREFEPLTLQQLRESVPRLRVRRDREHDTLEKVTLWAAEELEPAE